MPLPGQRSAKIVRVACLEDFYCGSDAVLAAMNVTGLDAFLGALKHAREQGFSQLNCDDRIHTFWLDVGAADIGLQDGRDDRVEWRLNPETTDEMIGMLTVMGESNGFCHNYVDIFTPAEMLVLSLDEYLEPNSSVHTSPFGYF